MPTPPLSPSPRRWRSSSDDEPHPDFAALLSSFDDRPAQSTSTEDRREWRERSHSSASDDEEKEVEFLTAPGSPARSPIPEIRTTSPSPRRPERSGSPSSSTDRSLSPLPAPPSRGQMFGDASGTAGRFAARGVVGPRDPTCEQRLQIKYNADT